MAKHDKGKGKDKGKGTRDRVSDGEAAGARPAVSEAAPNERVGHAAATAHGQAATDDMSLPATREELLDRHAAARRRRGAAALGSDAYREAADEIGRIEIRIAAVERDQVPPRG